MFLMKNMKNNTVVLFFTAINVRDIRSFYFRVPKIQRSS